MKLWDITITATCPPEEHWRWEQERDNGYTVDALHYTVRLEGHKRQIEDLLKLEALAIACPDHHIVLKEAKGE